jgi:HEPN domain-containing protein
VTLPSPQHIEEWRARARRDWQQMLVLMSNGFPDGAGVSLQQAIEKFLKGYLLSRGWTLTRTHNLGILAGEAATHEARIAAHLSMCRRVTNYYLADRYPDSLAAIPAAVAVRADAVEALRLIALLFPDETLQEP